ncbi:MAG: hypothetical protein AAF203_10325, partial [Pseudomonadota bacterium]
DEEIGKMTPDEYCSTFYSRAIGICKKAALQGDRQYGLIRFCYEKTLNKESLVQAICAQGIEKYGAWIRQDIVEACVDVDGVPRKVTECFDYVGQHPETTAAFIRSATWSFFKIGPSGT